MGLVAHIKLLKLCADFFHIFSFLPLFLVLRIGKKTAQGISRHSQELFCLALLLRYASSIIDAKETIRVVEWFADKAKSGNTDWDLDLAVNVYKKASQNAIYVYFLRMLPLIFSVSVVLKLRFSQVHRDVRDTMQAQYLYLPCFLAAFAIHNMELMGRSKAKDVVGMMKTASYMVEAVAILPQLYLQYAPGRAGVDDTQFNFALDLHLVTRGLWRGIYVACFLIGVVDKGRGLEGSFADNLPHLAGVLQIMINFDLFSAFLRRRFRSTAIFGALVWYLVSQNSKEQVVRFLIGSVVCSAVGGTVLGGFLTMNICVLVVIVQCYRGGVVTFRNPLEVVNEKMGGAGGGGGRRERQEEL